MKYKAWSRNYSRRNTVLLRKLIAEKRIVVDVEAGIVRWPNGKKINSEINFWGYERFRIMIRLKGHRKNAWFFTHKAVMLADGLKLKAFHEIDHKNFIRNDNRRENLQYIHRKLNNQRRQVEPEPAF